MPTTVEHAHTKRWFNQTEAGAYLDFTPRTIRNLIERGDLPAYRVGSSRSIRIAREDLDRLLRPISA